MTIRTQQIQIRGRLPVPQAPLFSGSPARTGSGAGRRQRSGHRAGTRGRHARPPVVSGWRRSSQRGGLDQAIRATRELIANPDVPAIFEGTFEHGGVLVRVDILHRRRDGRWRLIEVKSTTDVKEHHLDDVAIQHRVVTRSGVDLAAACLAHVNRDYVYDGRRHRPASDFSASAI